MDWSRGAQNLHSHGKQRAEVRDFHIGGAEAEDEE
jgi:hypothetical protein